eukprot:GHVT01008123.1.p2 GENE.GHVT01008123.1~~GHVT01008123.1.p2  ORF type:complete len:163 (-),score=2.97 GHVT01008123.1:266-754(-)
MTPKTNFPYLSQSHDIIHPCNWDCIACTTFKPRIVEVAPSRGLKKGSKRVGFHVPMPIRPTECCHSHVDSAVQPPPAIKTKIIPLLSFYAAASGLAFPTVFFWLSFIVACPLACPSSARGLPLRRGPHEELCARPTLWLARIRHVHPEPRLRRRMVELWRNF